MRGSSYLENKIIPEADIILFRNLIEDLKSGERFKGIGRPPSFSPARSYQTMTLKFMLPWNNGALGSNLRFSPRLLLSSAHFYQVVVDQPYLPVEQIKAFVR